MNKIYRSLRVFEFTKQMRHQQTNGNDQVTSIGDVCEPWTCLIPSYII